MRPTAVRATFISSATAFLFAISPLNAQTIQATVLTLRRPSDAELKNLDAPKLASLNIQDGRDLTDAGLEAIGKLDQLKTLYIHRSAGTDRGLAHLSRLKKVESLNIRLSPQYSEAALKHFKNLTELKQFEFSGTLTPAQVCCICGD